MTDPFDALERPASPAEPRPDFARSLRARLVDALELTDHPDVPTVRLPDRRSAMSTTARTEAATAITPYLAARDAVAALDWYVTAFGAVEDLRVVGDDGRLGHAELTIGSARFMLSDEYPEMGVHSPAGLGGTAVSLHLQVEDVDDLFARAVAAGATALREPADQSHGSRTATLLDPYGHRWMLSAQVEAFDLDTYRDRAADEGFEVVGAGDATVTAADRPGSGGGIWSAVFYTDARAGIRFLVEVFGFEEQLVVVAPDDRTVVHSELRWPEGGIVQVGTFDPDNPFTVAPGAQSLYVVTADPRTVWERSRGADLEVVRPPESPDHDPEGLSFSVRDPEGNVWSFGTYGLTT